MMRPLLLALALVALPSHAQAPVGDQAREKAIEAALDEQDRPMEHRLRDEGRRIGKIVAAAWSDDTMEGKRVLDVGAGGGYLSLVFSALVGKAGHVDIHNTPGWIAQFPGMDPERQRAWIKRGNIGWITASWDDLDAPAETYDVIVMGQVYHDVILESGDFEALNRRLLKMLKPGGLVVIEDHDAIETMHLGQQVGLHRINHGDVTGQFLRAGFIEAGMELFDSKYDDRRMNVFWPTARGRTDRFIAVFRKPGQ